MLSVISLFVASLMLAGLSEQALYPGTCSDYNFSAVKPFYPWTTLTGKIWFLIEADDVGLPYHDYDCIRFVHFVAPGTGKVKTSETAKNLATDKIENSPSYMDFPGRDGSYNYSTNGVTDQPTKIVIVDPLGSYYVEISCVDVGGQADIYVGIFSAFPALSSTALSDIHKYLDDHQIGTSNLRFVEQRLIKCGY